MQHPLSGTATNTVPEPSITLEEQSIMKSGQDKKTSRIPSTTSKKSKLNDLRVFLSAWLSSPLRTGANAPSSRFLARAMVAAAKTSPDTKVIELGPGTGIFTEALLNAGVKEENLTLIELNPDFRKLLSQRYPKVRIIDEDAFSFLSHLAKGKAKNEDYTIISGLPLLVFSKKKRIQMRKDSLDIIGKTGKVVQFTYGPKSPIPLDSSIEAQSSKRIWINIPPAVVWCYKTPGAKH